MSDDVASLLESAASATPDASTAQRLRLVRADLGGPLRVAVVGPVNAGKSTLVNALVGWSVAPTDAGESTIVPTSYGRGPALAARATVRGRQVPTEVAVRVDGEGRLQVEWRGLAPTVVEMLEVTVPSPTLEGIVLIDTPGLGSHTPSSGRRTLDLLAGQGASARPEAVMAVMRATGGLGDDVMAGLGEPALDAISGLDVLGVMTRAEELGDGMGLHEAEALAARWRRRLRTSGLASTVVPLSGLVAQGAAALTDDEYDDLCVLAALGDGVTAPLLVSADRIATSPGYPVPASRRRALVVRLGLVGVRWALDLLRMPVEGHVPMDRSTLVDSLTGASGLDDLRRVLIGRLTGRRDLLKIDAALRAVEEAARTSTASNGRELVGRIDRIRLQNNGFGERALLEALMADAVHLPMGIAARMEQLLVGGPDPVRSLEDEHGEWAALANDPLSSPDLARAAAVMRRACERHFGEQASVVAPDP